jgi:hypothetical protein
MPDNIGICPGGAFNVGRLVLDVRCFLVVIRLIFLAKRAWCLVMWLLAAQRVRPDDVHNDLKWTVPGVSNSGHKGMTRNGFAAALEET